MTSESFLLFIILKIVNSDLRYLYFSPRIVSGVIYNIQTITNLLIDEKEEKKNKN